MSSVYCSVLCNALNSKYACRMNFALSKMYKQIKCPMKAVQLRSRKMNASTLMIVTASVLSSAKREIKSCFS